MWRIAFCTVAIAFSMTAAQPAGAKEHDVHSRHAHHVRSLRKPHETPRQHQVRVRIQVRQTPLRIAAPVTQPTLVPAAHAYLMRGFLNVFSLGIDDLGAKIQAAGITATVANHADADMFLNQIVTRYQSGDHGPVILIGHSLGADAVIAMAQTLDRYDIPVALAILFDGTAPHAVPKNVAMAVNFTQQFEISPGPGFGGTISNVDLRGQEGIDHFTIDKAPALQAQALDDVLQAASGRAGPPTQRP
jgi:hypothetical protein